MSATVKVICNVINPKNLPARPRTQFSFTLAKLIGIDQLGVPNLQKLQSSDPALFNGSSAHAQVVLLDFTESFDYWVSDFVIESPGGSGPFKGSWNDDFDVDLVRFVGPFRVFNDDILDRPNIFELNGKLIPHQTVG
jgi:hypothetical protein